MMLKIISRSNVILHRETVTKCFYSLYKPAAPSKIKKQLKVDGEGPGMSFNDQWEPGFGPAQDFDTLPSRKELRKVGKILKQEFKKWKDEWKENLKIDPDIIITPGEIRKLYTFTKDEDMEDWTYTNDKEHEFGHSTCTLTRTQNGTLLFSGNLSTVTVQDGKTFRAGFCGFRSPRAIQSFARKSSYEWGQYNHIVLKLRGDGRNYIINVGQDDVFDATWYDSHSYFIHTRGGPYWQTVKIPFSKLVQTHKGKIQDRQEEFAPGMVTFVGITLADGIDGPFELEIEYFGLELDMRHDEETAYERYGVADILNPNRRHNEY